MERPKSIAKWGAACAQCSGAKAKCIRSDATAEKCDRCERLSKNCTSQVHKPRKKRASKPSKTAQLEQRLNGLVDLIRASGEKSGQGNVVSQELRDLMAQPSDQSQQNDPDPPRYASSSPQTSSLDEGPSRPAQDGLTTETIMVPPRYNSSVPESCTCRTDSSPVTISTGPPGSFLAVYRNNLSPLFPFVIVPPETTAEELQTSRPFLFSAIRMVTTLTSMRSMRAQMYKLISQVSDRVLIRSERSLDLLLGLIVMAGWHHYHCMVHSQLSNLIHLAQSLVGDLGLHRRVHQEKSREQPQQSLEEKRAFLAVWYLTSCSAVSFGKIESMKVSPYIRLCLHELETNSQVETDRTLWYMVRIQMLNEKIWDTTLQEQEFMLPRDPALASRDALQAELTSLETSLSQASINQKYLMVCLQTAQLRLREPPRIDAALIARITRSSVQVQDKTNCAVQTFYQASEALKAWFKHWFRIPISSYFYLPLTACVQLVYSVNILARWAKLVSPLPPKPAMSHPGRSEVSEPRQPAPRLISRLSAGTGNMGIGPPPNFDDVAYSSASSYSPSATSTATRLPPASTDALAKALGDIRFTEGGSIVPTLFRALKQLIDSMPEVRIDASGIMSQMASRCAQANHEMLQGRVGEADRNAWDLAGKKLNILRALIERYNERLAQGGPSTAPLPLHEGSTPASAGSLGYEYAKDDDNCMPCRPEVFWSISELDAESTKADEAFFAAAFPSAGVTDSYWTTSSMPFDPSLMGTNGSEASMQWLPELVDNHDPTVWDAVMTDWGTVNVF